MKILGIKEAQKNFSKILEEKILIIDKKHNKKKAVLIPYEEYLRLKKNYENLSIGQLEKGRFKKFKGILDKNFKTKDIRYNEIIGNQEWKYFLIQIYS